MVGCNWTSVIESEIVESECCAEKSFLEEDDEIAKEEDELKRSQAAILIMSNRCRIWPVFSIIRPSHRPRQPAPLRNHEVSGF